MSAIAVGIPLIDFAQKLVFFASNLTLQIVIFAS